MKAIQRSDYVEDWEYEEALEKEVARLKQQNSEMNDELKDSEMTLNIVTNQLAIDGKLNNQIVHLKSILTRVKRFCGPSDQRLIEQALKDK